MKMLHDDKRNYLVEINRKKPQELLHKCAGCGKMEKRLYQQNLCKSCLTVIFKRLVKVIDSVRK